MASKEVNKFDTARQLTVPINYEAKGAVLVFCCFVFETFSDSIIYGMNRNILIPTV